MKTLLSIAGLDPSAGAGILADLQVARDHDLRGMAVATALTVQDASGLRRFVVNPVAVVKEQLELLVGDEHVCAIKVGMLGDAEIARTVAAALASAGKPVVWDPVMAATGGESLVHGELDALADVMLPAVTVITPNLPEAEALTGLAVSSLDTMREAAQRLIERGVRAVIVKGGHLPGDANDLVVASDGPEPEIVLEGERVDCGPVHGTGCVFSSALACELAKGATLGVAARRAKRYLTDKLRRPIDVGGSVRCLV